MKTPFPNSVGASVAIAVMAIAKSAAAHSWIEQLMRIAPNGTMVGAPGYQRGAVARDDPAFNDNNQVWLIPPNGRAEGTKILATDKLCRPTQKYNPNPQMPKLDASPADFVALRYQENGHVTLPEVNPTKPLNRGTVYVYGYASNDDDLNFLDVWDQWTADGQGGNKKGRLLATRNYDDGQCYQENDGSISVGRQAQFHKVAVNPMGVNLWCQTDIQLPADVEVGKDYSLVWLWHWPTFKESGQPTDAPTEDNPITLEQFYTTCMDVSIVQGDKNHAPQGVKAAAQFSNSFASDQDLNNAAVKSQLTVGNFQVQVPGGPPEGSDSGPGSNTGSKSSASGPGPSQSSQGASRPSSTGAPPNSSSSSQGGGRPSPTGGFRTVTVTAAGAVVPTTVTVTHTVGTAQQRPTQTPPAQNSPASLSTSQVPAQATSLVPVLQGTDGALQVTGFLPHRRVRREAGEWDLGSR